ncbi:MAG: hypothetical protein ACOC1K_03575 [Nanoarchaeota archaeon]
MGKKEKVLKGKSLWSELEGKKDEIKETVEVEIADVKGEVTVVFRDLDVIREVEEEYEAKKPDKPILDDLNGLPPIEIPNDNPKYEKFNNHPKAKEWEEKVKPINNEKIYRLAYEFIADEEKPSEDADEGTKILQDRLKMMDAVNIMNKGMEISGFGNRLGKQSDNS